jgi:hypothetical protein
MIIARRRVIIAKSEIRRMSSGSVKRMNDVSISSGKTAGGASKSTKRTMVKSGAT